MNEAFCICLHSFCHLIQNVRCGSTGLGEDELEAYLASEVISLFAEGLLREKNPTIYELLNVPTTHGTGHDPYWI